MPTPAGHSDSPRVDLDQSGTSDTVSSRRLAIGLCTAVVAIAFESIAVATAMPVAARDLGRVSWYAWAFSLFMIGQLFATVAAGRICDRIGPGKPMMAGMVIFSVGLVVAGLAPTMLQLIAGRLIQGLGSGTMSVSTYVCIAYVYAARERPRMFSYISTAWVLPSFVGPPVAAWLARQFSWHWVFLAVLPVIAFAAVMVVPTLVRMHRIGKSKTRLAPAAGGDEEHGAEEPGGTDPAPLWAAGLAAAGTAIIQLAGQRLDWWSIALLAGGLAALLVSLPRLMPAKFLRLGTGLPAVIVVRGLMAGSFFGAEAFIPLMLVEQRHIELVLAGGVLTIGSLGWTTGSWIQSRPGLRLRRDRIITVGTGCIAVGLLLTATVAFLPALWIGLVPLSWVIGGFGMGMSFSSTSLAVMSVSPRRLQGRNASSLQFGEALGAGVFVGLAGTIFAFLHPGGHLPLTFGMVIAAMAAVAVLGLAMSFRIGPVNNELQPET